MHVVDDGLHMLMCMYDDGNTRSRQKAYGQGEAGRRKGRDSTDEMVMV